MGQFKHPNVITMHGLVIEEEPVSFGGTHNFFHGNNAFLDLREWRTALFRKDSSNIHGLQEVGPPITKKRSTALECFTVEPPNRGHIVGRPNILSAMKRLSSSRRSRNAWKILFFLEKLSSSRSSRNA